MLDIFVFHQSKFQFYLDQHSSLAGLKLNAPETSSEILDDVLKQLDKLSPEMRKKVLDRLTAANVLSSDLKTHTKLKNEATTETHGTKPTEASLDEVEILDLHHPKMGIYKMKRSKFALLFLLVEK